MDERCGHRNQDFQHAAETLLKHLSTVDPNNGDLCFGIRATSRRRSKSYRSALQIIERLASSDPQNTEWQGDLSSAHSNIGDILYDQGSFAEALESYRASLVITDGLVAKNPRTWIGNIRQARAHPKINPQVK
jgi:tetratricopeptide (TPR) repeat protein